MVEFQRTKLSRGYGEILQLVKTAVSPFAKTSKEEKENRRRRAETDLSYFARTYFPHHLSEKGSAMHEHLLSSFEKRILASRLQGTGSRTAQAAPRGHAKSTLSTLILPLWCVAARHRRFIGLLSDTTEQAEDFLETIKAELVANERLQEDFPQACGRGRIWKIGRIETLNGVRINCWGKRKRLRGARFGNRRPDLILCDDLEDDENIDSPEQREKDRRWFFKAVMKVGAPYTVFIVVGTLLHYDSLLARLLKQPGWTGKKWQAVLRWSSSPLWETWEQIYSNTASPQAQDQADAFFQQHRTAMLAGTEVLWPEVENYYYLMKMRVSDGPAFFDSEKQNEPIHPEDCLFREEWFKYWGDPGGQTASLEPQDRILCAVDPSMGRGRSDPSAILIGAVRQSGVIDILEADIRRRHPDAIMEDLFHYHTQYNFDRVVIEEVQFQEFFKDQVVRESARRGLYLPVEGIRPHADKTLRITKLQPHIKNGFIRFRRSDRQLLDQLKYFPKADHDDGPDALEMLFSLAARNQEGPRIRRLG